MVRLTTSTLGNGYQVTQIHTDVNRQRQSKTGITLLDKGSGNRKATFDRRRKSLPFWEDQWLERNPFRARTVLLG